MRRLTKTCLHLLFLLSTLIGAAGAADESFTYQFLGSPLLVLVVLLAIDALALLYHRIRR